MTSFSSRLPPWLALIGLALLVFLILSPFFSILAWAGVLAYASWPIAKRIRGWCGERNALAASLTTMLAALMLVIPLIWLLWIAQKEVMRIYPELQNLLSAPPPVPALLKQVPWLGDSLSHLLSAPEETMATVKNWLASHASSFAMLAGGLGRGIGKLVMMMVVLFFFYRDGARIVSELKLVLSRFIGSRIHDYLTAAGNTTRAVIYGILLTALVQGVVAGLGYWVAGLDSPVTLGVLTTLCALIPFATPVAWGSIGFWLFLHGETGAAIGVWLWGAAVVSQLDNFLRPYFISSVSPVPFLLILFGVLGGLLAFGLVGLFVGPIVLAIAWAVWREWVAHLE